MKHIKKFENMDWDGYSKKREMINTTIPNIISELEKFKNEVEDCKEFATDKLWGHFNSKKLRNYGYNSDLTTEICGKFDWINHGIGPHLGGEIVIKKGIIDKIFGKGSIYQSDSSLYGRIMMSVDGGFEELQKKEIEKIADKIWDIHPNNPKNKIVEEIPEITPEEREKFREENRKAADEWEEIYKYQQTEKYIIECIDECLIKTKTLKSNFEKIESLIRKHINNPEVSDKINEIKNMIGSPNKGSITSIFKKRNSIIDLLNNLKNKKN